VRDLDQPQLPAVLRTLAVPPFGVHSGGNVSDPIASPPLVAVEFTKPPFSQSALAVEPLVAIDVAVHGPFNAVASPLLPPVAVVVATPLLSASTNALLPGFDAWAVDLPPLSDSASDTA
jgi:hypothetical protein